MRDTQAWERPSLWSAAAILFAGLVLLAAVRPFGQDVPLSGDGGTVSADQSYADLPLSFEPNQGRMDPRVDFVTHTAAGAVYLTDSGAELAIGRGDRAETVSVDLAGARHSSPAAQHRLPGTVNDLRGDDPDRWRTGIPTYESIRYGAVYPGIDLDWHGSRESLEYDFSLMPMADPSRIALRIGGADALRLARNGDLLIEAGGRTMRQAAPLAHQPASGTELRRAVPARFELRGERVGFRLGAYDRTRPLLIDPVVLDYSSYLGGNGADRANAIAVDETGAAYVTGRTLSTDFDTAGPIESDEGDADVFVSKLSPDGDSVVYSTYLGGNDDDSGNGIAVDDSGAYLVGTTESTDFNTLNTPPDVVGAGRFSVDPDGSDIADVFVAKLNSSGDGLLYSTYLGSRTDSTHCSALENKVPGSDYGAAIAVDSNGSAYVAGTTYGVDFPVKGGYERNTAEGEKFGSTVSQNCSGLAGVGAGPSSLRSDAFVTKLSPAGNALEYSTYLGGDDGDGATAIAVDGAGSAYVAGSTNSPDYDTVGEIEGHSSGGNDDLGNSESSSSSFDAFVTKLNPAGNGLDYSTYLGGTDYDAANGIALDGAGSVYITGTTQSSDFDTENEIEGDSAGPDAFVSKLNAAGNGLDYSTYLGGTGEDAANAISVDPDNRAVITGETGSSDFDVAGEMEGDSGADDAFISSLAPNGGLSCSTYLGGAEDDSSHAIALDSSGAAHVAGATESNDFDTQDPIEQDAGDSDGFASKLTLDGPCEPHSAAGGSPGTRDGLQVYVVVLDGLRPQEINPALTPNLNDLKESGTWYEEARSVLLAETLPNHAAMMTGVLPGRSGLIGNDYQPQDGGLTPCNGYTCRMLDPAALDAPTLPTTLEESCDISTAAVMSKGYLWHLFGGEAPNPDDPDPQRRADYVWSPTSSDAYLGKPDDHTVDASVMRDGFLPWLRSAPESPRFAFLNLGDIDRSGHVDQSGATVPPGGIAAFRQTALSDTDTHVGLLVDELKSTGAWDNSVVIFTSDHGMDWSTPDHDTATGTGATTVQARSMPGVRRMVPGGATSMYYLLPGTDPKPIADKLASVPGIEVVATRQPVPGYPTLDDLGMDHPNTGDIVALNRAGYRESDNLNNPLPGNHGNGVTQHSTLFVTGGHPALDVVPQSVPGEKVYDPENGVFFRRPDGGPGNLSIAPTVAKLFGLEPPEGGYDGQPLDEAFDDWAFAPHTPCGAGNAPPSLSINDVSLTEGDAGTSEATFRVTLASPSQNPVEVTYRTADGTATAPDDYEASGSQTLRFEPGETEHIVSVPVNGDTVDEFDERFTVELSNVVNADLARVRGHATIHDDDFAQTPTGGGGSPAPGGPGGSPPSSTAGPTPPTARGCKRFKSKAKRRACARKKKRS